MSKSPSWRVGLVGWPVEHSVSSAMHNAAFAHLGLDGLYTLLPTPPAGLEQAIGQLAARGYRGVNVTVPHKQAARRHLHEIGEDAQTMGAVNTVVVQGARLIGHNTDAYGFLAALREAGYEPAGRPALVLGAGGAARAVVYALARAGCTITIHNRTGARAAALAAQMSGGGTGLRDTRMQVTTILAELDLENFDLLVNATSVGMWPQAEASPWPESLPLPSHWTVFDLVYNPEETRLLAQARAAGATPIGGLGMLIHQGARAFELWTGQRPPVDVMRAAAQKALGQGMVGEAGGKDEEEPAC